MHKLLIEYTPVDVLFFQDSQGIGAMSLSILPTALSLYGSLGETILKGNNFSTGSKHAILGDWCENLELNKCKVHTAGPFFIKDSLCYWKVPANARFQKNNIFYFFPGNEEISDLHFDSDKICLRYIEHNSHLDKNSDKRLEQKNIWINNTDLLFFLKGGHKHAPRKKLGEEDFFERELRVGQKICRKSKTTEESHLFCKEVLRPNMEKGKVMTKLGYAISSPEDITYIQENVVRLGGEGYKSKISISEACLPQTASKEDFFEAKKFFIYLATPSIFKNGFLPESWRFQTVVDKECTLVGVANEKPATISGMTSGKPRKTYKQVPSGAVYFFETMDWSKDDFQNLIDNVHGKQSQSEIYPAAGFGMPFIGLWRNECTK